MMQILPGDFMQDIWKNEFKVYANGRRFKVKHERVQLEMQTKKKVKQIVRKWMGQSRSRFGNCCWTVDGIYKFGRLQIESADILH